MATLGMGMGIGGNIFKARTGSARFHVLLSSSSSFSSCYSLKSELGRRFMGSLFLSRPPNSSTFCTSPVTNQQSSSSSLSSSDTTTTTTGGGGGDGGDGGVDKIKDAANLLDIRVGRIIKAWRHEEADSLYVEEVDVGESEPRIICSGLVNYIPIHLLQDAKVVVLANLKPRNMRGVKSNGMLLAASDHSHQNVELLQPPQASSPGDRIWFGSLLDKENQPPPATPNQIQKKKIWELVQPHLKTNASCIAMLGEDLMQTSEGAVVCTSLKNANIA